MARTGTFQTGKFDIRPGMAFIMPDMPNIIRNHDIGAGEHPWIVTDTYQDYITIVMCTTIECRKENKDKFEKFMARKDSYDIKDTCPPLDPTHKRFGGISANTATILPKRHLFSHKLKLCNESTKERNLTTERLRSLCIHPDKLKEISKDIENYYKESGYTWKDPTEFEEAEYDFYCLDTGDDKPTKYKTKEAYNKAFGWKHLPDANPFAAYPFEDQMHGYEKADPKLLTIARRKKTGTRKHRVDPSMDYLSEIDKARDTSHSGLGT